MNKNLFFVFLLCFGIGIFSQSFFDFGNMPYMESSIQTYPYFLRMNNFENFLFFFNSSIEINSDFITANEYNIKNVFFDESYKYTISHKRLNDIFLIKNTRRNLYYGINAMNSAFINKLYASLYSKNDDYFIVSYSNIEMYRDYPHKYNNQLFLNYKNIVSQIVFNTYNKMLLFGYKNDNILLLSGYSDDKSIPLNIKAKLFGLSLFSNIDYNYLNNDFNYNTMLLYVLKLDRFFIVPILKYNGEFNIFIGGLYRILPSISAFVNYSSYIDSNFVESGLKYTKANVFINASGEYSIENKDMDYKISSFLKYNYYNIGINASYRDSMEYSIIGNVFMNLYNGNLKPGIYVSFNNNNIFKTFIFTKLIDARIFFGNKWNFNDKTYILEGGLQWYFYE